MGKEPTLSVTVLSYNNEEYIAECLASLERQGVDDLEVFVVDDCSTDGSVKVINDFIKDRPNFRLIRKESNSGGAVSSQIGIAESSGKYLAIVDSDDIVADGAYSKLIRRIEEDGSDFAAGMPLRFVSGYLFAFLTNQREVDAFSENTVLQGPDKVKYSNQIYYWNSVYRADFIKNNDIRMPAGLMIADRVFAYQTIYKAEKISIEDSVVYYWRKKNNPDNLSIMDIGRNFEGVSDRCDSFEAQIRVTVDNADSESGLSLGIWENSFERLFYPLNRLLKENADKDLIEQICERYRVLLEKYRGFFLHLIDGGNIPSAYSYYAVKLLNGNYDDILKLAGAEDIGRAIEDAVAEEPDSEIKRTLIHDYADIGIVKISEENGRLFAYAYIADKTKRHISVKKIVAISRYINPVQHDLEYDNVRDRFEISGLPESSYNLMVVYDEHGERRIKEFDKGTKGSVPLFFETDERIVTTSKFGGNPLSIMRKSAYTFVRKGEDKLIYTNKKQNVKRLFFFNIFDNRTEELPQADDSLYLINADQLGKGNNILLAETYDGVFSTLSRYQFTNSVSQMKAFEHLFKTNRIEIIVT